MPLCPRPELPIPCSELPCVTALSPDPVSPGNMHLEPTLATPTSKLAGFVLRDRQQRQLHVAHGTDLCSAASHASFSVQLDPLGSVSYRPWEEAELRELGSAMGMTNFRRYRTRRFIMFCMERPGGGSQDHES